MLSQLQAVLLEHTDIQPHDQVVYRLDAGNLQKIEGSDEQIYQNGAPSFSAPAVDLVLLNKQIQSEADLKDLLIFAANDDDDMFNSRRIQIDLQNFLKADGTMNLKEISKNIGASGRLTGTGRYEQISASTLGLSEDITENFNFKKINSLSTQA